MYIHVVHLIVFGDYLITGLCSNSMTIFTLYKLLMAWLVSTYQLGLFVILISFSLSCLNDSLSPSLRLRIGSVAC